MQNPGRFNVLMKHLADGTIKQKKETYPETRDNIT
jgi:hypothetical protein